MPRTSSHRGGTMMPDQSTRILVVGAGSTGGYFGSRLAQAGRTVDFLVRPQRAAQLRDEGLRIMSPHGNFTIRPNIVTADTLSGPYDIVLLSVKGFSLDAVLNSIGPAIGPQTIVLPFLNGMCHLETIAARLGRKTLVGGVCRIVATLDPDGQILHLAEPHEISYGELDGSVSTRIRRLDTAMQDAGFDARLSLDIEQEMWKKWTLLATLGAATCLLRGTVGEINSTPRGTSVMNALLDEVLLTIQRVGKMPGPAALATIRAALTDKSSPQTASLYRDVLVGATVEADQVIGDLIERAESVGITTPLLSAAHVQLSIYGRRLTLP